MKVNITLDSDQAKILYNFINWTSIELLREYLTKVSEINWVDKPVKVDASQLDDVFWEIHSQLYNE